MKPTMEFRILGTLEVRDGTRRVPLPAGRGRALLALLVIHAPDVVAAERIIDELWGEEPPATASTVVQGLVSRLRKTLEPKRRAGEPFRVLETSGTGYRLAVAADDVDATHFQRLVLTARGEEVAARSALLAEALALWRGSALADFTYEPFAQRAITALDELRVTAIEDRVDADLALGRHVEAAAELQRLVVEHPFRERLHELRMLALYRCGRQSEALDAYHSARRLLVEEMGIEPGPGLQSMERAILHQDPALELESRREVTPIAERWLPRERRTVTVVAADLGATAPDGIDPEAFGRRRAQAIEVATAVLRSHGARVELAAAETLLALFGLPVAHEDDALRAVRAAVEVRRSVAALNTGSAFGAGIAFAPRAGVETGDIVVADHGNVTSGPVVTAATRLLGAAVDTDVLIGAGTLRLIRGRVVVRPVSRRTIRAGQAMEVLSDARAEAAPSGAAMFGRERELTRLRAAFRRVVRTGLSHRCVVVGDAGIGKSRLVEAFIESIGDAARVVTGRCPGYGEGITFLPLREAVIDAVGKNGIAAVFAAEPDGDALAHQVAGAIGLEPLQAGAAELFPAVRRLFELLAARAPLVFVVEDVHWAEPTFLDLLDLITATAHGPLLMVGLARPELIEARAAWSTLSPRSEALALEPLPAADIEELIADRSASPLPAEVLRRIVMTAQGNPLYAVHLLAAHGDEPMEAIPASLRGLLAMRLDRLGPAERDVLRCAAVAGTECAQAALIALIPDEARPFLHRHLDALARKQLIERDAVSLRFTHVLVQLAAYQSMAREDRVRLHQQYASWLEQDAEALPELDELVGYHLEQAVEDARASGTIGDIAPNLAERAGTRLSAAAERALSRFDIAAAENLLTRSRALLPADHALRGPMSQRLAETDLVLGRFDHAQELLSELIEAARGRGDSAYERTARVERARIRFIAGPATVSLADIRREADESVAASARAGDDAGHCHALFLRGCVEMRAGRMSLAANAFEEGLALADRAGDAREQLACRWMLATVLRLGPSPVRECVSRCEAMLEVRGSEHPGVLLELAMLRALTGAFDEARALNERARVAFVERFRVPRMMMFVAQSNALVEHLAGELVSAERELRVMLDFARDTAEREHISQGAARLASILRLTGRIAEAKEFAALSAASIPAGGVVEQALSKAALACAASDAGKHDDAERLARAAVATAPDEMPHLRADVLRDLAAALGAGGQTGAARSVAAEAARLYSAKGVAVR